MYCLEIKLRPTAALTFRIFPSSILNIATYPFVPPTSFSGYLRRLTMMQAGTNIPETKINKDNPATYLLPPEYVTLGAYPNLDQWSGIHRTYRKGMRKFGHDDFSKLFIEGKGENFQLHTWEYFLVEELIGYVISTSTEKLEKLRQLKNYGCYIGKEGYAYISDISDVIKLEHKKIAGFPSSIVPTDDILENGQWVGGCDIYNLYRYKWKQEAYKQMEEDGVWGGQPTQVDGFIPFTGTYFSRKFDELPILDFYTDSHNIFIPVSLVNLLNEKIHG
jgi:hypothetical protein